MKRIIILFAIMTSMLTADVSAQSQFSYEGMNDYGRMYDIIFHPTVENKLYALSLGNHIMYSDNKGVSWEVLYSFPDNGVHLKDLKLLSDTILTFSAQFSATHTENAVYFYDIAAGEITGQFTPPITPGTEKVWIDSYSVYSDNHDIALVHQGYTIGFSGYAKVFYTTDGGDNWQLVYYNEEHNGVFPNNVAISPGDPAKLFIARGVGPNPEQGGLFISDDGGLNWEEKIPGNAYNIISFHPSDPDTIMLGTFIGNEANGHQENLYRSIDGGENWNVIPIAWEEGIQDNITGIEFNPLDPDNVLVMEENEVVITHDNWLTHTRSVYPLDNLEGYYYGIHASFSPFQNGELFVNADYYPLFSEDGGATFSRMYNPFYFTVMAGLQQDEDIHLYHSVQRGLVHKNLNTGVENAYDVQPINLVFSSDAPIYMTDKLTTGRVYKYESSFIGSSLQVSDDFGSSYSVLYGNFFDRLINVTTDPGDPNVIWAVFLNEGGVIIDFNDINNPVATPVTLPEADILTDVLIDETDSNIVYITVGAHVYRSTDGGSSWDDISNDLGINPVTDIIFDIERSPFNANEFIVTASNGIYRTTNAAANWEQVYQGSNVRKVNYSPLHHEHLVATIPSGNGIDSKVVFSEDGGESWETLPLENMAYVGSASMAYKFNEENVDVYIATYDLGVIKYTIDLALMGVPGSSAPTNPFLVYPNPATDIINIEENGDLIVSVAIFNTLGQRIISSAATKQVDVSSLESGIYFIRIKNAEGNYFVSRIIKK